MTRNNTRIENNERYVAKRTVRSPIKKLPEECWAGTQYEPMYIFSVRNRRKCLNFFGMDRKRDHHRSDRIWGDNDCVVRFAGIEEDLERLRESCDWIKTTLMSVLNEFGMCRWLAFRIRLSTSAFHCFDLHFPVISNRRYSCCKSFSQLSGNFKRQSNKW